ncbi:uncharacterized protein LOC133304073 [Gastrolobium bilobum]|uniref:uncharacterized protein LOC133304073 n=1 Tax=Gastrolobium bilobum TaxID=150636 RepID=UPI002AAF8DAF|nr:uncharacterized protein LOC133304073 [Gastrolobium bilobum]
MTEDSGPSSEHQEGDPTQKSIDQCTLKGKKRVVSYKDVVLQLNGEEDEDRSDDEDWITIQKKEEEEDGKMMVEEEAKQGDPLCPVYKVCPIQYKEDCKKWRNALIIKLLGKRINNRFLMARLLKQWCLQGRFEIIDLENGYILINLHSEKEYFHVLHEGPWVFVEHYVTVQRWRPMFDPYDENIKRMAVWLRIPGLPIEFYSMQNLWKIGNLFGKTLKIDRNSLKKTDAGEGEYTEKGKYARICVEVDLRRSFFIQI